MLNGLGSLIEDESKKAGRIVDLFCGAGSVIKFAVDKTDNSVLAIDLQAYSVVLAEAILNRASSIDSEKLERTWLANIEKDRLQSTAWKKSVLLSSTRGRAVKSYVEEARQLCEHKAYVGLIWNAYGGHYFSPEQALTFDYMLKALPKDQVNRTVCKAAMIITAMRCAASPGHTAQPFQPTETARKFIMESWKRDPLDVCKVVLKEVCAQHARKVGVARVGDAVEEASKLNSNDLVIVDPPYSGVQYSRFYHVLETIAREQCGPVSGVGRYPSIEERPQSKFSNVGQSREALRNLLSNLSKSGTNVIFTFPEGECSNGLSGDIIHEEANRYFRITKEIVKGKFSTLGGNKKKRQPRQESSELILLMKSK